MAGSPRAGGTAFQFMADDQVKIVVASVDDLRTVLKLVDDFIASSDGHLVAYSGVSNKQAERIYAILDYTIGHGRQSITLTREEFIGLSALISRYGDHDHDRKAIKEGKTPPLSDEKYKKLKEEYDGACERLCPRP